MNLASVWKVPMIFYCENNLYGMSAPADKFVGGGDIPLRAKSFGIESASVNGNNVIDIYNAVNEAARYVRETGLPYLIESKTYRWLGHSKSDLRKYRTKEEEDSWKARCPLCYYENYLIEHKIISAHEAGRMKEKAAAQIEEDVKACIGGEILSVEDAMNYVYFGQEDEACR